MQRAWYLLAVSFILHTTAGAETGDAGAEEAFDGWVTLPAVKSPGRSFRAKIEMVAADTIQYTCEMSNDHYLALGFGYNMKGADMWVMTTKKTKKTPRVEDLKAVAYSEPPLDASQDYTMIDATQNKTHNIFVVQRKLDTGDADDTLIV